MNLQRGLSPGHIAAWRALEIDDDAPKNPAGNYEKSPWSSGHERLNQGLRGATIRARIPSIEKDDQQLASYNLASGAQAMRSVVSLPSRRFQNPPPIQIIQGAGPPAQKVSCCGHGRRPIVALGNREFDGPPSDQRPSACPAWAKACWFCFRAGLALIGPFLRFETEDLQTRGCRVSIVDCLLVCALKRPCPRRLISRYDNPVPTEGRGMQRRGGK